jgi:hypothetical protein
MGEQVIVGRCKCGGYGVVLNEEAEREIGKCHISANALDENAPVIGWFSLDKDHRRFIIRVRDGGGAKHSAEPHYSEDGETALWKKAEESGFIRCVGGYKWLITGKYVALERELLGI